MDSHDYCELNGIDGEPVEFEWSVFPGHKEIQRKKAENRVKLEEFNDRIIFMSMYNDIDWSKREENFRKCVSISTEVKAYAHRFAKLHWSFLRTRNRRKVIWNAPEGQWNRPVGGKRTPRSSSNKCFGPRIFEKIHYSGDLSTAELVFRTIISVNQLSVHGTISDWYGELAQQISDHSFSSTAKPVAKKSEQLDCRLSCRS